MYSSRKGQIVKDTVQDEAAERVILCAALAPLGRGARTAPGQADLPRICRICDRAEACTAAQPRSRTKKRKRSSVGRNQSFLQHRRFQVSFAPHSSDAEREVNEPTLKRRFTPTQFLQLANVFTPILTDLATRRALDARRCEVPY